MKGVSGVRLSPHTVLSPTSTPPPPHCSPCGWSRCAHRHPPARHGPRERACRHGPCERVCRHGPCERAFRARRYQAAATAAEVSRVCGKVAHCGRVDDQRRRWPSGGRLASRAGLGGGLVAQAVPRLILSARAARCSQQAHPVSGLREPRTDRIRVAADFAHQELHAARPRRCRRHWLPGVACVRANLISASCAYYLQQRTLALPACEVVHSTHKGARCQAACLPYSGGKTRE